MRDLASARERLALVLLCVSAACAGCMSEGLDRMVYSRGLGAALMAGAVHGRWLGSTGPGAGFRAEGLGRELVATYPGILGIPYSATFARIPLCDRDSGMTASERRLDITALWWPEIGVWRPGEHYAAVLVDTGLSILQVDAEDSTRDMNAVGWYFRPLLALSTTLYLDIHLFVDGHLWLGIDDDGLQLAAAASLGLRAGIAF